MDPQNSAEAAKEAVCCPKFDPAIWDNKTVTWANKKFIKGSIPTFFHMPLPMTISKLMMRLWSEAEKVKALPEGQDWLILSHDPSAWKSD
ncbi:MAG: hydrolase, partial [bacterium]